jgi:tetratricopeptide (TPR) repeat protein
MIYGSKNQKLIKMKKVSVVLLVATYLSLTTVVFACNTSKNTTVSDRDIFEIKRMEHFTENYIETSSMDNKNDNDSLVNVYRSLEDQYYKQKNYKDAYKPWSWLFNNAPSVSKNIFIHGVVICKYFIEEEGKENFIDTMMLVYDRRIEYFDQRGFVLGRKGIDHLKYRPNEFETSYGFFKESIELEANNTKSDVAYYYIFTSTLMVKSEKITEEELLGNFGKINDIIDANASGNEKSRWDQTRDNIVAIMVPWLQCNILIPFYEAQYESSKDELEKLKNMQSVLQMQKCTDSEVYSRISESVFEKEPSAKAAYSLGTAFQSKENYDKAIYYYKKAIELESESNIEKSKYHLALADLYKRTNNFSLSRTHAQTSASLNPDDGTPYILIGDLYASSANSCGNNDFEKAAVYWAAVDQYIIAKSKGSPEAENRINSYSARFPTTEKAFYHEVYEGDTVNIACWINVSTKARFLK